MATLAIETGIEPDYENALIAAAKKAGWSVRIVRHIPFSHEFEDLVHTMLSYDPAKRPTLSQIKSHPWFVSDDLQTQEEVISEMQKLLEMLRYPEC